MSTLLFTFSSLNRVSAGLPNIWGYLDHRNDTSSGNQFTDIGENGIYQSGALCYTLSPIKRKYMANGDSSGYVWDGFAIDANRCSEVYKTQYNTVTPESQKTNFLIKYA